MTESQIVNVLNREFWSRVEYDSAGQPHVKPAPPVMIEHPRAWHVTGIATTGKEPIKI